MATTLPQHEPKQSGEHEPRYKYLPIRADLIRDVLNWCRDPHVTRLALPVVDGVPEDVKVVDVWIDHSRRAFGVLLYHDSWPVVPCGAEPEWLIGNFQVQTITRENGVTNGESKTGQA